MSSAASENAAKPLRLPKRTHLITLLIAVFALSTITVCYLSTRNSSGIQVRWHLHDWRIGKLNKRMTMIVTPECYTAVVRGYHVGLCDVFRVTQEPPFTETAEHIFQRRR